jgi:hypothetical protein
VERHVFVSAIPLQAGTLVAMQEIRLLPASFMFYFFK